MGIFYVVLEVLKWTGSTARDLKFIAVYKAENAIQELKVTAFR